MILPVTLWNFWLIFNFKKWHKFERFCNILPIITKYIYINQFSHGNVNNHTSLLKLFSWKRFVQKKSSLAVKHTNTFWQMDFRALLLPPTFEKLSQQWTKTSFLTRSLFGTTFCPRNDRQVVENFLIWFIKISGIGARHLLLGVSKH